MSKHIRGTNEWNVLMPAPTIPQWPPEYWRQKKKKGQTVRSQFGAVVRGQRSPETVSQQQNQSKLIQVQIYRDTVCVVYFVFYHF